MYLWSIDIDAVLTGMSCFHLLCEEADIRCGSDEMAVTQILPNYNVYADIAQASTVLTTGRHRKEVPSNGSLFVFGSLGCAYVMLYRHFTLLKWKQTWSACFMYCCMPTRKMRHFLLVFAMVSRIWSIGVFWIFQEELLYRSESWHCWGKLTSTHQETLRWNIFVDIFSWILSYHYIVHFINFFQ